MKFSALVFLSFAALCGAQELNNVPAIAATPSGEGVIQEDSSSSVKELYSHVFPGITYFEIESDVYADTEILMLIEQALGAAANDAHDSSKFKFEGVLAKKVVIDDIDEDDDEDDFDSAIDNELVDKEPADLATSVGSMMAAPGRALRGILGGAMFQKNRNKKATANVGGSDKKKRSFIRQHRFRVTWNGVVQCGLCKDDDLMSGISPFSNQYYLSEEGRRTLVNWEKGFCSHLKKVKLLKNPKRCFIDLDVDHEN